MVPPSDRGADREDNFADTGSERRNTEAAEQAKDYAWDSANTHIQLVQSSDFGSIKLKKIENDEN